MARRAGLWGAFATVHLIVAVLGFWYPNQPMGDVYNVYQPWSDDVLRGGAIAGVDTDWVYPQLAHLPMLLGQLFAWPFGGWAWGYTVGWALVAVAVDAAAFALLMGRASSRARRRAAWFWLAFVLLLGPVGLYRLDGVTVALAIVGCLWLVGRPALGAAMLAVATWIKVWPAALLAAAFLAVRRRWSVVVGAAAVSAVTITAVLAAGGLDHLWGFVGGQTSRGIQVEAPVAAYALWRAAAGAEDSFVFWDPGILTFEVAGPGIDVVAAVMTPLLVVAILAVVILGAVQTRRGTSFARLFPAVALALVLAFIVFNKVGSPQYIGWLVPPLVVGVLVHRRGWRGPALVSLAIALLTQAVYPVAYDAVLRADVAAVTLLTVRNLLLVVLFVWAVVLVARVSIRPRAGHPAVADIA